MMKVLLLATMVYAWQMPGLIPKNYEKHDKLEISVG